MGKFTNWECFFTSSLIRFSSRYSCWSSLRWSTILVPRVRSALASGVTVNEPPAEDSQMYWSSSLCLECGDPVGHEESRVETDTELANHGHVGTGLDGLHERLGARLGDGSEVVHHIGLGHADARVGNGERVVALVSCDVDEEVLLGLELGGIGQALVANLVEGIGGVGDQLTKEDLLVRVE